MREITYVKAFTESLMQLMAEDEDVVVIGEDVAHYGGVFHAFDGLWKTYGEKRVIDTPISEMGFIGMGVGAAARGLRPVCDLMFFDFIGVCARPAVQPGGEAEVHVRRRRHGAAHAHHGRRCRPVRRAAAQPEPGGVARPRARA